jgi:DNA-binding NtrC family response regulator
VIPPLRERPEDIPALVQAFLARHSEGEVRSVAPDAIELLAAAEWPGNARELENAIERALVLSSNAELQVSDFPPEIVRSAGSSYGAKAMVQAASERRLTLDELQDLYIQEILQVTKGNKVQAGKILGIDRKTLYRRAERNALRAAAADEVADASATS